MHCIIPRLHRVGLGLRDDVQPFWNYRGQVRDLEASFGDSIVVINTLPLTRSSRIVSLFGACS